MAASYKNLPSQTAIRALQIGSLGLGAAAIGTMLLPTILPMLGVGDGDLAQAAVEAMHSTGTEQSNTFVSALSRGIGRIPLIGSTLVAGNTASAAIIGGIGLGGFFAGKFLEKREDGKHFSIGKAIRYGSLATSALFALPSLLTAIGIGVVYATAALEPNEALTVTQSVMDFFTSHIGVTGEQTISSGSAGVLATVPHLLTCGASLLPVGVGFAVELSDKSKGNKHNAPSQQASAPTPNILSLSQAERIKIIRNSELAAAPNL